MKRYFIILGIKIDYWKYAIFLAIYFFIFQAIIFPILIGSYLFVSCFISGISLLVTGLLNNNLFTILLYYLIGRKNNKRVIYIQYVLMFIMNLIGTYIYSFWIKMSFFAFLDHLIINFLSSYFLYNINIVYEEEDKNNNKNKNIL